MAKTIQVRADDDVEESADILFASLELDTSAAMEIEGITLSVDRNVNRDTALLDAIERHRAGNAQFLTREQCLRNANAAIRAGVSRGV